MQKIKMDIKLVSFMAAHISILIAIIAIISISLLMMNFYVHFPT